jgi:hypothetical protein
LTALVVRKPSPDPQIVGANASVEEAQALGNLDQSLHKQSAACGFGMDLDQQPPQARDPARCGYAMLAE